MPQPLNRRSSDSHLSTSRRAGPPAAVLLLAALAVVLLTVAPPGRARAGQPEVSISTADGFRAAELGANHPIVMFPITRRIAGAEPARRLSATLADEAAGSRFVAPGQVTTLLHQQFLESAYDSLVVSMATIQPASSFSVLSTVANRFAARHALIPVDVMIENSKEHYAVDMMFVLVDLISGSPRVIMSARDTIDGAQADRPGQQSALESETVRAILEALRKEGERI